MLEPCRRSQAGERWALVTAEEDVRRDQAGTGTAMRMGRGRRQSSCRASLGHAGLDGEQAAKLEVLDHRKLLQALQEGREGECRAHCCLAQASSATAPQRQPAWGSAAGRGISPGLPPGSQASSSTAQPFPAARALLAEAQPRSSSPAAPAAFSLMALKSFTLQAPGELQNAPGQSLSLSRAVPTLGPRHHPAAPRSCPDLTPGSQGLRPDKHQ